MARFLKPLVQVPFALFFSLLYGLLWIPIGLLTRLTADWLRRKPHPDSGWWKRAQRLNQPEHLKEPF